MATVIPKRATIDDLLRTEGKAELIGGKVVPLTPTGFRPSRIAARIFWSLDDHAESVGRGFAFTDSMGFTVSELPSGRGSFCPDASYYDGPPPPKRMRFIEGPPTFAVEVRSEGDYGASAGRALAEKRADYFSAGTLVVWDVDAVEGKILVYRAGDPEQPITYTTGQEADAEPALPGWRVAVDRMIGSD